jgi:hypothetical protein
MVTNISYSPKYARNFLQVLSDLIGASILVVHKLTFYILHVFNLPLYHIYILPLIIYTLSFF